LSTLKGQDDARLKAGIKFDFAVLLAADNKLDDALNYAKESFGIFKQLGESKRVKTVKDLISEIKRRRRWF